MNNLHEKYVQDYELLIQNDNKTVCLNFGKIASPIKEDLIKIYNQYCFLKRNAKLMCVEDYYLEQFIQEDYLLEGDIIYTKLVNLLDSIQIGQIGKFRRSAAQRDIHNLLLQSVMPFIYGREWEQRKEAILKEKNLTKINRFIMISLARRHGKTVSLSWFIACFITVVQRDVKIALFAQKQFIANKFIEWIVTFLKKIPGAYERSDISISDSKPSTIKFKWSSDPKEDKTIITAYPTSGDSNRGITFDLVFFDELAFTPLGTLVTVIIPCLRVMNTVFCGISSPSSDGDNFFNRMCKMKDKYGDPLFATYIRENRCDKCDHLAKCIHLNEPDPDWLDNCSDQLKVFYELAPHMYESEIKGVISTVQTNLFDGNKVDESLNTVYNSVGETIDFIGIYFDPGAGGSTSNSALCTVFYTRSSMNLMVIFLLYTLMFLMDHSYDPVDVK